jgi:transposase
MHENKLILCAIALKLKWYMKWIEEKKMSVCELNWSRIYNEVSEDFHVRRVHVVALYQQFIKDGDVLVFGKGDNSKRGPKMLVHRKLNQQQGQSIVDVTDSYHIDGRTVTNRKIRNHIKLEYGIVLSKMTVSNYFKRLGLTWKKVTNKRRSVGEYRLDMLRSYIINYYAIVTAINNDPVNCRYVIVATDKSYIYRLHCCGYLYMKKVEVPINRSNNKGERMIIMHAITPHGPSQQHKRTC